MQTRLYLTVFVLGIFGLSACNSAPSTEEAGATTDQAAVEKAFDDLKEEYHSVMAATFHPAEEDNLEPVKAQYADLAGKAEVWSTAALPEKYQEKGLDKSLSLLTKESKAIGELIQNGASDEKIKKAIFALHDRFHEIQGKCEDGH